MLFLSLQIRRWIASCILDHDSQTTDLEVNTAAAKGIIIGNPDELLHRCYSPPGSSTLSYFIGLKGIYRATSTHCAFGPKCHSDNDMVYSAAPKCRDYYHLACIKDKTKKLPDIYKCPSCSQPQIKNTF